MDSKKKDLIKVNVADSWSTYMKLDSILTSSQICKKVSEKHLYSNSQFVERFLCITAHKAEKMPTDMQIYKRLYPEENISTLEQELNAKKIAHDYYVLSEDPYNPPPHTQLSEYDDKFFKKGKWERIGDLNKLNRDKKWIKRSYYLGIDNLYRINKEKNSKVKVFELNSLDVKEESETKDNAITITIDPSKVITLKAVNPLEHPMWYNGLLQGTRHAQVKPKFEAFNKGVERVEKKIADYEGEDIEGFFSGVENQLKVVESREMLFEELTSQIPDIGFLYILYDLVNKYEAYCTYDQFPEALKNAKRIHKMVGSFYSNAVNGEEVKMGNGIDPKDSKEAEVMGVNREISKVVNEIFSKQLQNSLTELNKLDDTQYSILDKALFKELETRMIAKISTLYKEIEKNRKSNEKTSKLLSIPAIQFRKSLKDPPSSDLLEELVKTQHRSEVASPQKQTRSMTIMVVKGGLTRKTFARKGTLRQTEIESENNHLYLTEQKSIPMS